MTSLSWIRPIFEPKLYTGKARVEVQKSEKDPDSKKIKSVWEVLFEDLECRLSHITNTNSNSLPLPEAEQTIKLFTFPRSEIDIPEGSKITITQDGVTEIYGHSGVSNNFETHQEIVLTKWNKGI